MCCFLFFRCDILSTLARPSVSRDLYCCCSTDAVCAKKQRPACDARTVVAISGLTGLRPISHNSQTAKRLMRSLSLSILSYVSCHDPVAHCFVSVELDSCRFLCFSIERSVFCFASSEWVLLNVRCLTRSQLRCRAASTTTVLVTEVAT